MPPEQGTPLAAPAAVSPAAAPGEAADPGRSDPVAWLIALAAFAAYTTISVFRYLRLDPGSWDLGIYTQYVWQIAHLHAPVVAIRGPGFDLLGDHFQPIVALVAPFFRLFPTPVTLLVAQAALTAVSVVPVCRAARARLGTGVSRVIGAAYGFSWGLQQMIIFDFHEIAFAVPLLACSLSALVRRRPRAAAAWALPLVFVKEDQGLTVAAIGLVMIAQAAGARMRQRRERAADGGGARAGAWAGADGGGARAGAWAGAVLVLWGLGWSALAIAVIIPHFNPAHHYAYWSDGGVISPAGGHISAGGLLAQLTNAGPVKLRTTVMVLLPVVFLALRSPLATVAMPGLALRFLSTNSSFWGTRWHYSAVLMPIAFVAAVDGLARIQARAARRQARAGNASRRAYPPWGQPGAASQEASAAPGRGRAAGAGRAGGPVRRRGHGGDRGPAGVQVPAGGPVEPQDVPGHTPCQGRAGGTRPDSGRDHGGVDADHARAPGRPRQRHLDRHRREPGPALRRVRRRQQRLRPPARRRGRLHQLALSRRDLSDDLQGGRRLPLPPYRERVAVHGPRPPWAWPSRKPAAAV